MEIKDLSSEQIIFSGVLNSSDISHRERRQKLVSLFNDETVFKNEYYILYKIIKDNNPNIKLSDEFILRYMSFNRANILNSGCVDIGGYGSDDAYAEFANVTVQVYKEMQGIEISDQDFETALEEFRMIYITDKTLNVLEQASVILTDGKRVGRQKYVGYAGAKSYITQQFSQIDNVVEKANRKGTIIYGVNENEEQEEVEPAKLITTFGVEKLDEAIGGLYEGDMLSLLAPAKGGKSRFATWILHHAVVTHKCNIVMWSLENGVKGWEALLRARHFEHLYNSNITDIGSKNLIDDDMIKKNKMSDKIKEMEKASWIDLKYNENYGKIANMDEEFDLDTFIEKLDSTVNAVNAKLVCIDYLQLISGDRYGSKNERIATAYQKTLRYLKSKGIAGIFPGQFKQSVVTDLSKKDDIANVEMRDSGGETYEVIKTPDINLSLYGTMEDIKDGYLKCISIPSRTVAPFEPFDMIVDFGTSTFRSIDGRA